MPPDPPLRLFFALWPEAGLQRSLHRLAVDATRRCGGRPTAADNIHLTLAFLGDVLPERLPALLALAGDLRTPAFSLVIDRLGYWRHNHILWAGCRNAPAGLAALAGELNARLTDGGWPTGLRPGQKFTPHLTLVRKAASSPETSECPPLQWPCRRFSLIRSRLSARGAAYEAIAEWTLPTLSASDAGKVK